MAAVIEVEELRKRYGGLTAVDGISFRWPSGRCSGSSAPCVSATPSSGCWS